ncbi:MAG: tRNA (adenosine(37)-N6)-threonylcarbamoyltransferase complex ATPase subunit type 1 TsaE [Meiothermus sp.]|uniref:tRNA (adenosine(37)-N6)-threonylcarbamoyltransferase complex ATPase subunit type 1 TsaE n=1 Tax=Meiothermus sp. TaxID=1955249 RepID=UPI0025FC04BB|nr:tRNA (adenosine(37)-N6)-threonylcarbamoyltransferase complex ATPase subunit type 1 TsaE [Meiothermus sp.]MCS7069478.1 tRNA (adenosine(37)-N6)-threonylcarbamoyltransferase complex ATPase subunit type 1 TsaE [Meiothermus sp.]
MLLESLEDTRTLARQLAERLPEGTLVLLTGPLGAGKTTLVKLIAEALGFEGEVTSPTYTLIHEYPTPQGLVVHIDAYRMADQAELYSLGLEDYLPEARLVLIEWGQPEVFPDSLEIRLTPTEQGRSVELISHGQAQAITLA